MAEILGIRLAELPDPAAEPASTEYADFIGNLVEALRLPESVRKAIGTEQEYSDLIDDLAAAVDLEQGITDLLTPRIRKYLFYFVLDTSESMPVPPRGGQLGDAPLTQFVRLIPRMMRELADHPVVSSLASVSVLAFNDEPEILRPTAPLNQVVPINKPRLGYGTDYAAVLKFIVAQHAKDVRTVKLDLGRDGYNVDVAPPWIFFITDGRPFARDRDQMEAEWMEHRNRLTDPPIEARIKAIGLPGADPYVLSKLATGDEQGRHDAFIVDRWNKPSQPASVVDAILKRVVDATQRSVTMSARAGLLTTEAPAGMRRIESLR